MSSTAVLITHFLIKVDGANLQSSLMDLVLDVTIQDDLDMPDFCSISFEDASGDQLDSHPFDFGKAIEVSIAEGEESGATLVFKGEVTGLHHDLNAMGSRIITVEAMSKLHRMNRQRNRKAYQNVKFSDIAQTLGGECGVSVEAADSQEVFKWLFQNNETNFEFLRRCAHEVGFEIFMERDETLHFRRAVDTSRNPEVALEWGMELRSFNVSTKASGQVNEVTVKGWDFGKKEAIVGVSSSSQSHPQIGLGKSGGQAARSAFSDAKLEVVDQPVQTPAHATALAKAVLDEINSEFITAAGTAYGLATLKAGILVDISKVGQKYSGKYFLTSVTHHYTPAEGYTSSFVCSGKRPISLANVLGGSEDRFKNRLGNSIVVGIVTNNNVSGDGQAGPDCGYVKVKYPWLQDDQESYWARVVAPDAGPDRGFQFMPEVNDEVLVAFEHGDMRRPYVIGRLWNGRDATTDANSSLVKNGKVVRRRIKTRTGHLLEFNEEDGVAEDIHFRTAKGKHDFCYSDRDQKCAVNTGPNMVTMEWDCQGHMTVKCMGNVKYDVTGNFDIDCKGKVTIKGLAGIQLDTPAMFQAQGTASAEVKSAATVTVAGSASTTIGMSGTVTITGGLVKIN